MTLPVLSYSAIKDFKTCAYKFYKTRVTKEYRSPPTEQTDYGERLHKAAETYIGEGTPLEPEFSFLKPILDSLRGKTGQFYPELEMAVTVKREPCEWNAPEAWIRGIADLVIVNEEKGTAFVVDYKTGNDRFADIEQLRLMALLVFAHFPKVKKVKGALLFVVKNRMIKFDMERRDADSDMGWVRIAENVARISAAYDGNIWNATQSGLCRKHCPVSDCLFYGE